MLLSQKEEIEKWLNQYDVTNYKLIPDDKYGYIVDVNDSVILFKRNLKQIEVKFNRIKGKFTCSNNFLTNLEGSPEIVGGSFDCSDNMLRTLESGPKIVGNDYDCSYNKLISLKGIPKKVENLYCYYNSIRTLKYFPEIINYDLALGCNNLNVNTLNYIPNNLNLSYIDLSLNEKLDEIQEVSSSEELNNILNIYNEKNNILKKMNKLNTINKIKINKI